MGPGTVNNSPSAAAAAAAEHQAALRRAEEARQRALEAARKAAEAARKAAEEARRQAVEARQKADAARHAAEMAEDLAVKGKPQADRAKQLREIAKQDELAAQKKEAIADLRDKQKTLQDSKLDDAVKQRAPNDPSAATVSAQQKADEAQVLESLYEPPAEGQATPLASSSAETQALLKKMQTAYKPVLNGKANPNQQAAAQQAHQGWLVSVQHDMRLAAATASSQGQDPSKAIQQQADLALKQVKDGKFFDVDSLAGGVNSVRDGVLAESPDMRKLNLGYEDTLKAGQTKLANANQAASAADAAAAQAQTDANHLDLRGYSGQERAEMRTASQAEVKRLQHEAELAHRQVDQLKLLYGSSAAPNGNPDLAPPGTVTTDYEVKAADLTVDDLQARIQVGEPGLEDQLVQAKHQQQIAHDRQKLASDLAEHSDAATEWADAKKAVDLEALQQPTTHVVEYQGRGGKSKVTVTPDGYDEGFWVRGIDDQKRPDCIKQEADGTYYYVKQTGRYGETKEKLNPVSQRYWAAHDKNFDTMNDVKASGQQLAEHVEDKGLSGQAPQVIADGKGLGAAQTKADADASQALWNTQHPKPGDDADVLSVKLGEALQAQQRTGLQVAQLKAAQALQAAERSGEPPNSDHIKQLRTDLRKATADLAEPAHASPDEIKARKDALPSLRDQMDAANAKVSKLTPPAVYGPAAKAPAKSAELKAAEQDALRLQTQVADSETWLAEAAAGSKALAAPAEYAQHTFVKPHPSLFIEKRTNSGYGDTVTADIYPDNYDPTWSIKPNGDDQNGVLADGLPKGLSADDVEVTRGCGGEWFVTFKKDSDVLGRKPDLIVAYVVPKGSYKMNEATAKLWQAQADQKSTQARVDFLDTQAALKPEPAVGADGKPAPALNLGDDLAARKLKVDNQVVTTTGAVADAKTKLEAGAGDPKLLQQTYDDAVESHTLALSEQQVVNDALAWQQSNRQLQMAESQQHAGQTVDDIAGLRERTTDRLRESVKSRANWHQLGREHQVKLAEQDVVAKQALHTQWQRQNPGLADSTQAKSYQDLAASQSELANAKSNLQAGAVPTSQAQNKAFIAGKLQAGQENNPQALVRLFNDDPAAMTQHIFNAYYAQGGAQPVQAQGRTQIGNEVGFALGWQPSIALDPNAPANNLQLRQSQNLFAGLGGEQQKMLDKVSGKIADIGGDQAQITVVPVVYGIDDPKHGGIVKTAIFKVAQADGRGDKYVDEMGREYTSLDDYRHNNTLPADGVKLVMPEDGNLSLDSHGNVKLFVGDARVESNWEKVEHNPWVQWGVAGVGVAAGVVLTVGSLGTLAVPGALLATASVALVGASAYSATTSGHNLYNEAQHGGSINPFTNRQARLDWLNLGSSVVALPTLGATGRAAVAGANLMRTERVAASASRLGGNASTTAKGASLEAKAASLQARAPAWQAQQAKWAPIGDKLSAPTALSGAVAMEENTRYTYDNWSQMSDTEKRQQGLNLALNLVDIGSRPVARGYVKVHNSVKTMSAGALQQGTGSVSHLPAVEPRTPGLGTHATMDQLLASGALPGSEGVTIPSGRHTGEFSYGKLYQLSTREGRKVEFALTIENVNGQRVRRLYSGSAVHCPIPAGARPVAHTHPTPHSNQRFASPGDMHVLNTRHEAELAINPVAAPRPHFVVWGERTGPQGDYTAVFPGPFTHGYGHPSALQDHTSASGSSVRRNDSTLNDPLPLIGSSRGQMRRDAEALISADTTHVLSFLLNGTRLFNHNDFIAQRNARAADIISSDPNHPLRFMLDDSGHRLRKLTSSPSDQALKARAVSILRQDPEGELGFLLGARYKLKGGRQPKAAEVLQRHPEHPLHFLLAPSGKELRTLGSSSHDKQLKARAVEYLLAHPDDALSPLLNTRHELKAGLGHDELADLPQLLEMGHLVSAKVGEKARAQQKKYLDQAHQALMRQASNLSPADKAIFRKALAEQAQELAARGQPPEMLMLQGAWENQYNRISIESGHLGGEVLAQTAVNLGGVAVDLQTARMWVDNGLLDAAVLKKAPRIQLSHAPAEAELSPRQVGEGLTRFGTEWLKRQAAGEPLPVVQRESLTVAQRGPENVLRQEFGEPVADGAAADAGPAQAARQPTELQRAIDAALATKNVGVDDSAGFPGWRANTDVQDVAARYGIDLTMPVPDGLRMRVYEPVGENRQAGFKPMVAFRGTVLSSRANWRENVRQARGHESDYNHYAAAVGQQLRSAGTDVTLVGHSLGGRLAEVAATASGLDAITFNAAGVHAASVPEGLPGAGRITAYQTAGDPVTALHRHDAMPSAAGEAIALAGRRGRPITNHRIGQSIDALRSLVRDPSDLDPSLLESTRIAPDDRRMQPILRALRRPGDAHGEATARLLESGELHLNQFKRDPLGMNRDGFYVNHADYIGVTAGRGVWTRPARLAGIAAHEAVHYQQRGAANPHSLDIEMQATRVQGAVDARHWTNRLDDRQLRQVLSQQASQHEPGAVGTVLSARRKPSRRKAAQQSVSTASTQAGSMNSVATPATASRRRVYGSATVGLLATGGVAFAAETFVAPHSPGIGPLTLVAAGSLMRAGSKALRFGHARYWDRQHRLMNKKLTTKGEFEMIANRLVHDGQKRIRGGGVPAHRKDAFNAAAQAVSDLKMKPGEFRFAYRRRVTQAVEQLTTSARQVGVKPSAVTKARVGLSARVASKAVFDQTLRRHDRVVDRLDRFMRGVPADKKIELRQNLDAVKDAEAKLRDATPLNDKQALLQLEKAMNDLGTIGADLRPGTSHVRWALDAVYTASYAVGLGSVWHNALAGNLPHGVVAGTLTGMLAAANAFDSIRIGGTRFDDVLRYLRGRKNKMAADAPGVDGHALFKKVLAGGDDGLSFLAGAGLAALALKNGLPHPTYQELVRQIGTVAYTGTSGYQLGETLLRRFNDPTPDQRSRYLRSRVLGGAGSLALIAASLMAGGLIEKPQAAPLAPPPAKVVDDVREPMPGHGPMPISAPLQRVVHADPHDAARNSMWDIASTDVDWILTPQQQAAAGGPNALKRKASEALAAFNGFDPALMDGRITARKNVPHDPDLLPQDWKVNVNVLGLRTPPGKA